VNACQEGAIQLVNGKGKLVREDYCDGLGRCLPACPTNAISFEEVEAAMSPQTVKQPSDDPPVGGCCPSLSTKTFDRKSVQETSVQTTAATPRTELNQWPIQMKLVVPGAQFFQGAHLLVAADCVAFAYGNFHSEFMKNKVTVIGCPKLDEVDYAEKLTAILQANDIKSVTIARMEVPCCAGLAEMTKRALENYGTLIPWQIVTISIDGNILED